MNLPFSQLDGEGTYQFRFTAAVAKHSSELATTLQIVKELNLAYPQLELVGCPNANDSNQEYISEKDNTKICQCLLKEVGNPPGVAQWLDAQGNIVGQNGSLSLVYNSDDQAPSYTCKGYSGLGSGPTITYQPKFAYGPSVIAVIFLSQPETMNNCEPDASFITYCYIPLQNVNPEPTTTVTTSDGSTVNEQSSNNTAGYYRNMFKVTPEKGGNVTVTCSSFNPIFPELRIDKNKTIEIQEPPQYSPMMTVEVGQQLVANSRFITVTDGDDVKVTCRVDGGFPTVNEVTTTCTDVKNVNGGIQATQIIYVKKEDNGQKCICEAKHVTGCYHKTSEFILNVRYAPTLREYKANSIYTELTVSADDTVTFVCQADGNPRPIVSVRGQRWGGVVKLQNIPSGSYSKKISGSKKMSCKDTDVYTCMADNYVGGRMSKDISVFVECVPELPLTSFIQEFSPTNGNDLEIEIPMIGFPDPKNYSLRKVSDNYRKKRAATTDETGDAQYNVTYISDNPPKGVVVLTMMGLTERDSGQYVLTIDNGIKDGLDYSFNVSIISENNNRSDDDDDDEDYDDDDDDDDDDDNTLIIGLVIGLAAAVVLTASLCMVLVKVRTNRFVKERQTLKQEVQQYKQQLQQTQAQKQQQPKQLERHQLHYEQIGLNEYDGLNILDTQEQANDYQHVGPNDARERSSCHHQIVTQADAMDPRNPVTGPREDISTEQRGGPLSNQGSGYENEGFQFDLGNRTDVGLSSKYQKVIIPDSSSAKQVIGKDFPEEGVERPGDYVNVKGFKEPFAMTSDKSEANDDSPVYSEAIDVVPEAKESHSAYEIPNRWP